MTESVGPGVIRETVETRIEENPAKTQWLNRSIWTLSVLLAGCGESNLTSSFDSSGDRSGNYTVTETHTITAADARRLIAETVNGSISIETRPDVLSVTVDVTKVVRGPSRQLSMDFVRLLETEVGRVGDEVLIKTTWPRNTNGYDASARYVVIAPEGLHLPLGTVNGSIVVDGRVAETDAKTVNGRVEVRGASGSMSLATVNGRLEARLAEVSSESQFATVIGSIDVEIDAATSPVTATTTNGSISVTVGSEFAGQLDARTGTGKAGSDFVVNPLQPVRPNRLVGRIGAGGGPEIHLRSGNGNVRLKRG
ncbi:MAG: hypothetical protein CME26_16140 [Gemmatimonadetes bacterium]|nr:hypothetical protein [Gemmatimonadota bacterium]